MFWIVLVYGFGLRSAFYATIVRFSDARDDYYPKKTVEICGTEARNILSMLSIAAEITDMACSIFCLPQCKFLWALSFTFTSTNDPLVYIIRKAIVDGIVLARYSGRSSPRFYGLLLLLGITIYTVVTCSKLGLGAVFDTTVNILIEIMMKPAKRRWH